MQIDQLLTQYNAKLLHVLNDLEDISSQLSRKTVQEVTKLANQVEKLIRRQGYVSLGTGVLTGATGIAAQVNYPNDAAAKRFMPLLPTFTGKFGDGINTFQRGKETRTQLIERLLQEHVLPAMKETKNKYEEARRNLEDKLSSLMQLQAESFRTH